MAAAVATLGSTVVFHGNAFGGIINYWFVVSSNKKAAQKPNGALETLAE